MCCRITSHELGCGELDEALISVSGRAMTQMARALVHIAWGANKHNKDLVAWVFY